MAFGGNDGVAPEYYMLEVHYHNPELLDSKLITTNYQTQHIKPMILLYINIQYTSQQLALLYKAS